MKRCQVSTDSISTLFYLPELCTLENCPSFYSILPSWDVYIYEMSTPPRIWRRHMRRYTSLVIGTIIECTYRIPHLWGICNRRVRISSMVVTPVTCIHANALLQFLFDRHFHHDKRYFNTSDWVHRRMPSLNLGTLPPSVPHTTLLAIAISFVLRLIITIRKDRRWNFALWHWQDFQGGLPYFP